MSRRQFYLYLLLVDMTLAGGNCFAQVNPLSYRPVSAAYSQPLDRLITISTNPNTLHIYDPVSQKDQVVNLVQPPLALSLSPDGLHAAVGHDALISYVNLKTVAVEKTFQVPVTANSVVLSQTWIYVMPTYVGGSISLNLSTGAVTNNGAVFYGTQGWLNTAVNAIYGTRDGTSPNDVEEYDISTGPITRQFDSPYHGDYCIYGPVWFSPDGARIYTGCATIFRASKDPSLDMYYVSTLKGTPSIGALSESALLQNIALIPSGANYSSLPTDDQVVKIYDSVYLKPIAQFALAPFSVGGTGFAAHGKWLFYNASSTELIVVMEADKNSGLLNDFAVERIPLAKPTAACGAVFATTSTNITGSGSLASVGITASATCIYQAATLTAWIQLVSGVYGAGNGTLTYTVRPNTTGSARSGSISVGDQVFIVNQSTQATSPSFSMMSFNALDVGYAKPADKIVLVSAGPDELHIYDPNSHADQTVPLALPPLSVSVSPDGTHAAVGHDGWVTYVNLQSAAVEKTFAVITDVSHVLLAGNGYAYLFPARDWSDIYSLQISTGIATATSAIYDGRVPRLYASGNSMYLGGNWFSKWDISQGVAKITNSNGLNTCGNFWLTEDGRRAFTACAKAYTTSDVPAQDAQYNGSLSAATSIAWADESAQQHTTAVIPVGNTSGITSVLTAGDTQVQLYNDDFLAYQGAIPLPQYSVGGKNYPGHGHYVFWNKGGTALYVVMQADSAANLLSGTAIAQVAPSAAVQLSVVTAVHGATEVQGRIAPGEIVTIYGAGLGPANGASFNVDPIAGKVSFNVAGTQVYFDGRPAPVLYTSATQVNAIVPYEEGTTGQSVMQVGYQGIFTTGTTLTLASAIPGIFTMDGSGTGQAIATNLDGTLCDAAHPASPGSYITVYFTGGGYTNPSGVTGGVAGTVLKRLSLTALATVGGQPATVSFAGAAPYFVEGVGQLNLRLADNTPTGNAVPIILTVGINSSPNTATIAVR